MNCRSIPGMRSSQPRRRAKRRRNRRAKGKSSPRRKRPFSWKRTHSRWKWAISSCAPAAAASCCMTWPGQTSTRTGIPHSPWRYGISPSWRSSGRSACCSPAVRASAWSVFCKEEQNGLVSKIARRGAAQGRTPATAAQGGGGRRQGRRTVQNDLQR